MNVSKEIEKTLANLGRTPTEIAHTLEVKGVKGARFDSTTCPIQRYLSEQFPEQRFVVGDKRVHAFIVPSSDAVGLEEKTAELELTPTVKAFIRMFDRGQYEALEAEW